MKFKNWTLSTGGFSALGSTTILSMFGQISSIVGFLLGYSLGYETSHDYWVVGDFLTS